MHNLLGGSHARRMLLKEDWKIPQAKNIKIRSSDVATVRRSFPLEHR